MTYTKVYNEQGELTNPITKNNPFISGASQRTQKRSYMKSERFKGNGKNHPLTVVKTLKYLRHVQVINQKDGTVKRLHHYILQ